MSIIFFLGGGEGVLFLCFLRHLKFFFFQKVGLRPCRNAHAGMLLLMTMMMMMRMMIMIIAINLDRFG